MNRIRRTFGALKKRKEKALIVFLTAGDPSLAKNERLIPALERHGADLIELGVPFSDPLADGPVIQQSSLRALKRGTTLKKIMGLVRRARKHSQIPILLMSYLNPILRYGTARFAGDAAAAGVDGLIVPDLPPEEGKEISRLLSRRGLDLVYLLAPTSDARRQALIGRSSRGFVYYVSITGVTGLRRSLPAALRRKIISAKKRTRLPVCVGFGVSTPAQAGTMAAAADGVIVGSAIVRALAQHPELGAEAFAGRFVHPFAAAVKGNRWRRR